MLDRFILSKELRASYYKLEVLSKEESLHKSNIENLNFDKINSINSDKRELKAYIDYLLDNFFDIISA